MSGNPYHAQKGKFIGGTLRKCPRCGRTYNGCPAISRADNKTEICSVCGQKEALDTFQGYLKVKHERNE